MHVLIAAGVVWVCVGTPLACGLGSVLRSATGGEEARWRVLEIADAFLAATARAADALGASDADPSMHEFVGHRHRAAMVRVELAALLGESCDAIQRSTDVLAVLGVLAAGDDGDGRQRAVLQDRRAAFARAVWEAVGTTGVSARHSRIPLTGAAVPTTSGDGRRQ